jgi:hypothetical protein
VGEAQKKSEEEKRERRLEGIEKNFIPLRTEQVFCTFILPINMIYLTLMRKHSSRE